MNKLNEAKNIYKSLSTMEPCYNEIHQRSELSVRQVWLRNLEWIYIRNNYVDICRPTVIHKILAA